MGQDPGAGRLSQLQGGVEAPARGLDRWADFEFDPATGALTSVRSPSNDDYQALADIEIAVSDTLESAALAHEGCVASGSAETRLFIQPGFEFQVTDALITNFHLPESTLLMLVCAFGGYDAVMQAYREAVANGYRFFSYGDAMWLERSHV